MPSDSPGASAAFGACTVGPDLRACARTFDHTLAMPLARRLARVHHRPRRRHTSEHERARASTCVRARIARTPHSRHHARSRPLVISDCATAARCAPTSLGAASRRCAGAPGPRSRAAAVRGRRVTRAGRGRSLRSSAAAVIGRARTRSDLSQFMWARSSYLARVIIRDNVWDLAQVTALT